MNKTLKTLHLVGVAAYLGSVFAHIVTGMVEPWADAAATVQTARDAVAAATWLVTVPGLALAIVTGALMIASRRIALRTTPWLAAHALVGIAIAANAAALVIPAGAVMAEQAALIDTAAFDAVVYLDALKTEAIAGGVNVVLGIAAVALGVAKPAFRRYRAGTRPAA